MNEVTREDVLALAVRADRCGRKNLAYNLYAVAELMAQSCDGLRLDDVAGHATAGMNRADKLGIGIAAGMVS